MRDFQIREVLRATALKKFISDSGSKIVDELDLPITRSRIDIAVVNGHFHGYEIKSARDTLQRLPHQVEGYSKVFDYLTIVTENKHHDRILEIIPDWVGLKVCEKTKKGAAIKTIRKSYINKKKEGFFIAKLLWRAEAIEILQALQIPFKHKFTLWRLCEILEDNLSVSQLSQIVRDKLKTRPDWKAKEYYS